MWELSASQSEKFRVFVTPFTLPTAEGQRICFNPKYNSLLSLIPGISLYHNRIKNDVKVTRETLAAMEGRIADTAGMILPGMPLDVLAFGCTSASMVIGPSR